MTKKHFVALANALRPYRKEIPPDVLDAITRFCESQNPDFKKERWLKFLNGKCGVNGGQLKKGGK